MSDETVCGRSFPKYEAILQQDDDDAMDQEETGRRSCGSYEANVVHERYSDEIYLSFNYMLYTKKRQVFIP
jgi:hypothetical protein